MPKTATHGFVGRLLSENSSSSQEVNAGPEHSARGRIFLVLGPVGAGKTTFAQTLAGQRRALRLTLDEWIAVLFRPDRPREGLIPWYRERAERCVAQIWATAVEAQGAGVDVILEIGLLTRQERAAFTARVCEAGVELEVYVLNASRQTRWARVERRNVEQGTTFSAVVPREIFDLPVTRGSQWTRRSSRELPCISYPSPTRENPAVLVRSS